MAYPKFHSQIWLYIVFYSSYTHSSCFSLSSVTPTPCQARRTGLKEQRKKRYINLRSLLSRRTLTQLLAPSKAWSCALMLLLLKEWSAVSPLLVVSLRSPCKRTLSSLLSLLAHSSSIPLPAPRMLRRLNKLRNKLRRVRNECLIFYIVYRHIL